MALTIEDVKYAVPKSEKYNQFYALKFNDDRNLSVCNFYAWHEEEYKSGDKKRTKKVTDFRGVLYAVTLTEVYQGHVRIVPTLRGISFISANIPMNICFRCRTPRRSWMRGRWKKRLST
ncbi:hypothetical protein [Oribacterium sp.]